MFVFLVISTVITLACFVTSVTASRGIPVSLSDTYYSLGDYGWVFQTLMAAIACTLYPVWFGVVDASLQCLPFLTCCALLFVACVPAFRLSLQGAVHYSSAAVCCFCAVLWQVFEGLWDVTLWCALIGLMLTLQDRSKWCWWVEWSVVVSVYLNLYRAM